MDALPAADPAFMRLAQAFGMLAMFFLALCVALPRRSAIRIGPAYAFGVCVLLTIAASLFAVVIGSSLLGRIDPAPHRLMHSAGGTVWVRGGDR